jgi:ATP-binding cassette, subfamily B, bacterial MsbA
MKTYLRILGYLRPHGGLFAVSIAAMTLHAALDAFSFTLLIPFLNVLFTGAGGADLLGEGTSPIHRLLDWLLGGMIDPERPMVALRNVVLVMFVVFLVKNVAAYVQQFTVSVIEGRVTRDLRNQIYRHVLGLGLPFFQRMRSGQVISRITVDVDQVRTLVTSNLAKALSSAIQVLVFLVVLLSLSWQLTLMALLFLPPMLGLWARFRKRLYVGIHKVLDAVGDLSSQIQESVGGIRLVKASGAEEWEDRRFRDVTGRHYTAWVRNERWRQFFPPATEMITAVAVLGLLWFGSYLVLEAGALGASAFLAFPGGGHEADVAGEVAGPLPGTGAARPRRGRAGLPPRRYASRDRGAARCPAGAGLRGGAADRGGELRLRAGRAGAPRHRPRGGCG